MKRLILLVLLSVLCISQTLAQRTITGKVTDASDGTGLPGVNVVVKGTTVGTATDFNGNYTISTPSDAKILVFSSIGMTTQEVAIKGSTLNVTLSSDSELVDEVMVVGYGTSTKNTFTGTATQISAEKLESKSTSNVSQALTGEVAGVTVINTSGQPGTTSAIRIRGFGSVNGNRDPLYVVDGVPFKGSINSINPADIESTTVLKDASATAIYGSQGANGVIVITTKKGKIGKPQIEVDVKYGVNFRHLPEYDRILNQEEYMEVSWDGLRNNAILENETNPEQWASENLFGKYGVDTDYNMWKGDPTSYIDQATGKFNPNIQRNYTPESWEDYLFQKAKRTEANIRLSGGKDNTKYSTSFGFLDDEGYSINSNYKRYTGRLSVSHQPKEWLTGSMNMGYSSSKMNTGGQSSATSENVFYFADNMPSIYPVFLYDKDGKKVKDSYYGGHQFDFGEKGRGFSALTNAAESARHNIFLREANELNGNTYLEARFLKDFKASSRFGLQYYTSPYSQLTNPFYGSAASTGGSLFKTRTDVFSWVLTNSLEYSRNFDLHNVKVALYQEASSYDRTYGSTFKKELIDPFNTENANAVVTESANSYVWNYRLTSYFAQANYDYNGRYFGALTVRHDGSSRFKNEKWGTFYSIGGAWLISNENFLADNNVINHLKLKMSYGITGDQSGAENNSNSQIAGGSYYQGDDLYQIGNLNDKPNFVFYSKGNPDLTWEKSEMFQIGIEGEFLGKRLTAELDYYLKNTKDMFFSRRVGPSIGYALITVNDGEMRNSGLEFNLNAKVIDLSDFRLNLILNGEILRNKMTRMPIEPATGEEKTLDIQGYYGRASGYSLYDFYMREYVGVDQETGASIWTQYYDDKNTNGVLDEGEEISSLHEYKQQNPKANIAKTTTQSYSKATESFTGDSAIPKLRGAFRLEAEYKGFELSAQFLYQFGGVAYDAVYANFMDNGKPGANNWHTDMRDRWQKPGDITNIPRYSADHSSDQRVISESSRFLISSNYLALNNLRLGYNFPNKLIKSMGLGGLSVWVSGDNLWLKSKRDGFNPLTTETGASERTRYEPLTTLTGGLRVQF